MDSGALNQAGVLFKNKTDTLLRPQLPLVSAYLKQYIGELLEYLPLAPEAF